MQKRLTALFVLASALLATASVQAHTSKAHTKPAHAKHAQQKQVHASRAHLKHSKLAAATHKTLRGHRHPTHLAAATTRIANIGLPIVIDAAELKPDTALTTSGAQYLTVQSVGATNAVPAWLDHAPAFNSAQMLVQSDVPTFYGKLAVASGNASPRNSAPVDSELADVNQRVSSAIGSGDTAAVRQALIAMAMQLRDIRYTRGGHDPSTGFDCSGFVRYVFAHAIGMQLPTNSASQFLDGLRVKRADMKPGDLVFFHTHGKRRISHVGIYISDGRFIHSPTTGKSVQISSLDEAYWARHFAGAKRPQAIAMAARS
jgi:cell wall-associated NlpC family hydrolase